MAQGLHSATHRDLACLRENRVLFQGVKGFGQTEGPAAGHKVVRLQLMTPRHMCITHLTDNECVCVCVCAR